MMWLPPSVCSSLSGLWMTLAAAVSSSWPCLYVQPSTLPRDSRMMESVVLGRHWCGL
jgi:hypothetical protein